MLRNLVWKSYKLYWFTSMHVLQEVIIARLNKATTREEKVLLNAVDCWAEQLIERMRKTHTFKDWWNFNMQGGGQLIAQELLDIVSRIGDPLPPTINEVLSKFPGHTQTSLN